MERTLSMSEIEQQDQEHNQPLWPSFSETDLQLVVGADDLKSIERDILLFEQNSKKFQMIVTSPAPKMTGAIRFGAGEFFCVHGKNSFFIQKVVARDRGLRASISVDEELPRLVLDKMPATRHQA